MADEIGDECRHVGVDGRAINVVFGRKRVAERRHRHARTIEQLPDARRGAVETEILARGDMEQHDLAVHVAPDDVWMDAKGGRKRNGIHVSPKYLAERYDVIGYSGRKVAQL